MTFDLAFPQLFLFLFVTARVGGVVMVAPGFGAGSLPVRLRALLVLALSLLIAPMQSSQPIETPENLAQLVWLTGNELGVGIVLGFGVNLIFVAAQLAGQVIGQMSGMQAADVFNPTLGTTIPLFSQMLDTMLLVVFVALGGHQLVIGALLDTFRGLPVTQVHWESGTIETLIGLLGESFALGLKVAAPVTVTMLVSLLVLGLISRTLPQLNLMQIGFSMNTLLTLFVLSATLGGSVIWFDEQLFRSVDLLRDQLVGGLIPPPVP